MKEYVINWVGVLALALCIFFGLAYVVNSPAHMSDGHKAADARYRLCLQTIVEVNGDHYNAVDPSKCDGALGQYKDIK